MVTGVQILLHPVFVNFWVKIQGLFSPSPLRIIINLKLLPAKLVVHKPTDRSCGKRRKRKKQHFEYTLKVDRSSTDRSRFIYFGYAVGFREVFSLACEVRLAVHAVHNAPHLF